MTRRCLPGELRVEDRSLQELNVTGGAAGTVEPDPKREKQRRQQRPSTLLHVDRDRSGESQPPRTLSGWVICPRNSGDTLANL